MRPKLQVFCIEGNVTLRHVNPNFLVELQLDMQLVRGIILFARDGRGSDAYYFVNLLCEFNEFNPPPPPDPSLDPRMNFNQIFVNMRVNVGYRRV